MSWDGIKRREHDGDWDEIKKFIEESRIYRATDMVNQKFQSENLERLANQVTKQNGRVTDLEKWREEVKIKIQDRKDSKSNTISLITIIATAIMAVSAIVMIFHH